MRRGNRNVVGTPPANDRGAGGHRAGIARAVDGRTGGSGG